MNTFRRPLIGLLVLCGALDFTSSAQAQAYPNKPIRVIVPYAPGGSTDILARIFSAKLSAIVAQQAIVENRGGAGTLLGTRMVLREPADGYTLLFTTSAIAVSAATYRAAGYTLKDFKLVGTAGLFNQTLMINKTLPIRTLAELVAYAKANPGKLNFGSLGRGSSSQLLSQRFMSDARINMLEVPYTGSGPSELALARGDITVLMTGADTVHMQTDHSLPLAVTSETRLRIAPNVPTFVESGFPNMVSAQWFAFFAPAAIPASVANVLIPAFARVQQDKEVVIALDKLGIRPHDGALTAFDSMISLDSERMRADIVRLNLQADE